MQFKYCAVVLCLLSVFALGQNQRAGSAAPARGAVAEVLRLDPNTNTAVVRIVNTSNKDITAFTVALVGVYADGNTHRAERMVDFLPAMITHQVDMGITSGAEGAFHSGQSEEETASFTKIPGNPLARLDVHVEVIAYADQTVEVGNEEAFGRLLDERKGSLLAKQRTVDIINKALSNPAASHPIASAVSDLQDLHDRSKTEHTGELRGELALIIRDLQDISERAIERNSTGSKSLRDYAAIKEKEVSMLSAHTQLRRQP